MSEITKEVEQAIRATIASSMTHDGQELEDAAKEIALAAIRAIYDSHVWCDGDDLRQELRQALGREIGQ